MSIETTENLKSYQTNGENIQILNDEIKNGNTNISSQNDKISRVIKDPFNSSMFNYLINKQNEEPTPFRLESSKAVLSAANCFDYIGRNPNMVI